MLKGIKFGCLVLLVVLAVSFPIFSQSLPEEDYYRGTVLNVEETGETGYHQGSLKQVAEIKLTTGPYQDQVVTIENIYLADRQQLSTLLEEGMSVIVVAYENVDGLIEFQLQDIARDRGLLLLLTGFIILLLAVGWMKGVKTLISLAFTALIIAKLMFPLLLEGHSPIPVTVLAAGIIIIFVLLVIGGFNYKSTAAILGTCVGVLAAGILAYNMGEIVNLTGFSSNEAQMLLTGDFNIDIRGLLFSGIIIGSLGAVTDVAMSIASSAAQIREANPLITFKELFAAAFNVGRDIMGTMSNTLILAYVGGSIHLLLVLMRFEMNWLRIINMDLIATEVVRGLAGSIGLIISIPVTAFFSALFMVRKR